MLRRHSAISAVLLLAAIAQASAETAAVDAPIDPIAQRVATFRQSALKLIVDGRRADWEGLWTAADPGDDADDPSRDIVGTSIAPRDADLLIRIDTREAPSQDDLAFWFNIDCLGHQIHDVRLGLSSSGEHVMHVLANGSVLETVVARQVQAAVGEVVEARVPYSTMETAMTDAGMKVGARRGWCRVLPHTWNRETDAYPDHGGAAASYLLTDPAPNPDPPLPKKFREPRSFLFPLEGRWYLGQGAYGTWTHQNTWGYDFYIVDPTMHPSDPRGGKNNEDYFSWDRPVVAPANGTVIRARNNAKDGPPGQSTAGNQPVNAVVLDLGDGTVMWAGHLRKGSVLAKRKRRVKAGTPIGHVGNSGRSGWPHLHLGLGHLGQEAATLPIALSDVRVGLNPDPSDPWQRELERWEPREGFFVERLIRP